MKILNLVFFLTITFSISYSQNWRWIAPYPQGNTLYSICTVDNYLYFGGLLKTVVSSTDLGQTFNNLPQFSKLVDWQGDPTSQNIAFVDSINGYLLDISADEYKTTNGGLTWMKSAKGTGRTLINFYDRNKGWKFSSGGYDYTTNGGETWTTYNPSVFKNTGRASKTFALDSQVWFLKSYSIDSGGHIYSSTSPGVWNEQLIDLPSHTDNELFLTDIKVTPSGYGIVVGYIDSVAYDGYKHNKGAILKTTDFGNTWTSSSVSYDNQAFSAVFTKSDSEWVILGSSIDMYSKTTNILSLKSNDFGNNWSSKIFSPQYFNKAVYSAVYLKNKNKIIFTSDFDIYASNDFGDTIERLNKDLPKLTNFVLDKTIKTSSQPGFAAQFNSNRIMVSNNGGVSWEEKILPLQVSSDIRILDIAAASDCLYLIFKNNVYKYTDKGAAWSLINTPTNYHFYKFSVLDSLHMTLLADSSKTTHLFYTENGGKTWSHSPFRGKCKFSDLKLYQPGKILGCGTYYDSLSPGFIFQSTNKGLAWKITLFPQVPDYINNFTDTSFIASGRDVVFKSGSNGNLWYTVIPPTDMEIRGNFCLGDSYSIYFKAGYYIIRYLAATDTWIPVYNDPPLGEFASKIEFNYQNNMLILGGGGLIINMNTNIEDIKDNSAPEIVDHYLLYQNYPNPFNPSTTINYSLPKAGFVKLNIYNILGSKVATIVNDYKPAGNYSVQFDSSNLASGVYLYRLEVGNYSAAKKFILMK